MRKTAVLLASLLALLGASLVASPPAHAIWGFKHSSWSWTTDDMIRVTCIGGGVYHLAGGVTAPCSVSTAAPWGWAPGGLHMACYRPGVGWRNAMGNTVNVHGWNIDNCRVGPAAATAQFPVL